MSFLQGNQSFSSCFCNLSFLFLFFSAYVSFFYFFDTLVFSLFVSHSPNCCFLCFALIFTSIREKLRVKLWVLLMLSHYILPEYLYRLLAIGFFLHWQEHATVRLDAELINLLCLDIKLYRFAVADNFFLCSTLSQQHICFLLFPHAVVRVVSIFVAVLS